MVKLRGDAETWDQDWNQFTSDMQAHADAEPQRAPQVNSFVETVQRALTQTTPEPAPEPVSEPATETDPALAGWEELRAKRRGADRDAVRQRWLQGAEQDEAESRVGTSPLARELEETGWLAAREAEHAAERERERQRAIRDSEEAAREAARWGGEGELYPGQVDATRRIAEGIRETPRWLAQQFRQVPGGAMGGAGSGLQGVETVIAGAQHTHQAERLWKLDAINAAERGEAVPASQTGDFQRDAQRNAFLAGLRRASPQDRARFRTEVEAEIAAFDPTPVQDRPLYRRGTRLQEQGRELFPHLEGYDEQSVATQLGRGLGSMLVGLPVTWLAGPVGGAAVFGPMGIGEATDRAVQFDRRERAAGRPGISQDQIILAGLLGTAPGVTDVAPIESMISRLRVPGMTGMAANTLAQVVSRLGGRVVAQALTEGGQEGFQQILQNLIAQRVYAPGQAIDEGAWWSAVIGAGVGAETELGRTALVRLGRLGRGGRVGSPAPRPETPERAWAEAEARSANALGYGAVVGRRRARS